MPRRKRVFPVVLETPGGEKITLKLRYTMESMWEIQEAFGVGFEELKVDAANVGDAMTLLYAGLLHESPHEQLGELTPKTVARMIPIDQVAAVLAVVSEAVETSFAGLAKEKKGDGTPLGSGTGKK
jgi:hypothetical protein